MCIFCLVCSAHAEICSSGSQQIEQSEYSDTSACFNCETWGEVWNRLRPCHSTAPIHSTCAVYFCVSRFPAKKKSRPEKRTFSTGENGKWLTFVAARTVFMPYAGGKLRGFGSMTVVQTWLSYLSLVPLCLEDFFFSNSSTGNRVLLSHFFSLLLFFRRRSKQRHKKNSTILSFFPDFPHSFNTVDFFFAESAPKIDSFYGQEKWGVRGRKDPFTLENCGHTALLNSSAHADFP